MKKVGWLSGIDDSSADLDGNQGAGKILGGEREVLSGGHNARGQSGRDGVDEGRRVADGLLEEELGILWIFWDLVDRALVYQGHH